MDKSELRFIYSLSVKNSEHGYMITANTLRLILKTCLQSATSKAEWMERYGGTLQSLLETNTSVYNFLKTKYYRAVSYADIAKRVAETQIPHSLTTAIDSLDTDFSNTNTVNNPLREWTDAYVKLDAMYSDIVKTSVGSLLAACPQMRVTVEGAGQVCYDLYKQLKHCRYCGSLTTFYYPFCCICFLPFSLADMNETRRLITTARTVSQYRERFESNGKGITPMSVFGTEEFSSYGYTYITPRYIPGELLDPRHMYYMVLRAISLRDAYWMGRPIPDMGVEYQRMRILVERIKLFPTVLMPWYMCIPAQITTSDEAVRADLRVIGGVGYDLEDQPMEEAKGAFYFNDFPDVSASLLDLQNIILTINQIDQEGIASVSMTDGGLLSNMDLAKDTIVSYSLTKFNNLLALANGQLNAAICLRMAKHHRLFPVRFTLKSPEMTKIDPRDLLKGSRVNRDLGVRVSEIMNSFAVTPDNAYSFLIGGDELFVYAALMSLRVLSAVTDESARAATAEFRMPNSTREATEYFEYIKNLELFPKKCTPFNIFGGYYTIICEALSMKGIISPFKYIPSVVMGLTESKVITFEITAEGAIVVPQIHNPIETGDLVHSGVAIILYDSTNNITRVPIVNSSMGVLCVVLVSCQYENSLEYMYNFVKKVAAVRLQLRGKHEVYTYSHWSFFYALGMSYQHFWEFSGICHSTKFPEIKEFVEDIGKHILTLTGPASFTDTTNLKKISLQNLSHISPTEYNVRASDMTSYIKNNIVKVYEGIQLVFYLLTGKALSSSDPAAFTSAVFWNVIFSYSVSREA